MFYKEVSAAMPQTIFGSTNTVTVNSFFLSVKNVLKKPFSVIQNHACNGKVKLDVKGSSIKNLYF